MNNERFKASKIIILVLVFVLGIVLVKTTFSNNTVKTNNDKKDVELMSGLHHVVISVKDLGDIKVELDADMAPITVTNFLKLVNDKFYDGLTFHRIMKGFMIQGGDPTGTGYGGSDEQIKGEFISNGINNTISHVRGTISMARGKYPDSASSQFFIVQSDSTYLDGDYAGFGHVTEGIEVVDKVVAAVEGKVGYNGAVEAKDQPVITSITQID
jgi:peptidyl-prolyl cis-trans isomerase B (cyclophilin B)